MYVYTYSRHDNWQYNLLPASCPLSTTFSFSNSYTLVFMCCNSSRSRVMARTVAAARQLCNVFPRIIRA